MRDKITLGKKEVSKGNIIYLEKYKTDHPKSISKTTKKGWHPKFDGSYEVVIRLNRQEGGHYSHNTHHRLSWYIGLKDFRRVYDTMLNESDFHIIKKRLGRMITPKMNHHSTRISIEYLLKEVSQLRQTRLNPRILSGYVKILEDLQGNLDIRSIGFRMTSENRKYHIFDKGAIKLIEIVSKEINYSPKEEFSWSFGGHGLNSPEKINKQFTLLTENAKLALSGEKTRKKLR